MTKPGSAFPPLSVLGLRALWRRKHIQVGRVGWPLCHFIAWTVSGIGWGSFLEVWKHEKKGEVKRVLAESSRWWMGPPTLKRDEKRATLGERPRGLGVGTRTWQIPERGRTLWPLRRGEVIRS